MNPSIKLWSYVALGIGFLIFMGTLYTKGWLACKASQDTKTAKQIIERQSNLLKVEKRYEKRIQTINEQPEDNTPVGNVVTYSLDGLQ